MPSDVYIALDIATDSNVIATADGYYVLKCDTQVNAITTLILRNLDNYMDIESSNAYYNSIKIPAKIGDTIRISYASNSSSVVIKIYFVYSVKSAKKLGLL